MIAAGGIERYKRIHLNALVASFAPKFSHLLPKEMVESVIEFVFHVGDYCPGEYGWEEYGWRAELYLRKLIKAANEEAVFDFSDSDD